MAVRGYPPKGGEANAARIVAVAQPTTLGTIRAQQQQRRIEAECRRFERELRKAQLELERQLRRFR